jgi:Ala-tRNA(Pro) deacylase
LFPDCAKGAVPALGAAYGLETFLDEALTSLANVYFEAGDHRHLLRVSGDAFAELLAGARRGHFSGLS